MKDTSTIGKWWSYLKDRKMGWLALVLLLLWVMLALGSLLGMGNYSPTEIHLKLANLPPLTSGPKGTFLLGTDGLGRDLFAGILNGASLSLQISLISVFAAAFIGLLVGSATGYFGNREIKKNIPQLLWLAICGVLAGYYLVQLADGFATVFEIIVLLILAGTYPFLNRLLGRFAFKKYPFPLDAIVTKLFEVRYSLPLLFVLLVLAALFKTQSIYNLILVLVLVKWITIARYARAEAMNLAGQDFILQAKASGQNQWSIIWQHMIPNILPSVVVVVAFSFSSVILIEATLSFLGIGTPIETVTWGKILAGSRQSPTAWWLAVFPGILILFVVFAFNTIGEITSDFLKGR